MFYRPPFRSNDRPAPRDFPVTLEMQFRVLSGPDIRGIGHTLWMSSREIIFEADRHLPVGTELEITIAWPARLDNRVGLQLWVEARVVHKLTQGVTAAIRKHQFRTRGQMAASSAGDSAAPAFGVPRCFATMSARGL